MDDKLNTDDGNNERPGTKETSRGHENRSICVKENGTLDDGRTHTSLTSTEVTSFNGSTVNGDTEEPKGHCFCSSKNGRYKKECSIVGSRQTLETDQHGDKQQYSDSNYPYSMYMAISIFVTIAVPPMGIPALCLSLRARRFHRAGQLRKSWKSVMNSLILSSAGLAILAFIVASLYCFGLWRYWFHDNGNEKSEIPKKDVPNVIKDEAGHLFNHLINSRPTGPVAEHRAHSPILNMTRFQMMSMQASQVSGGNVHAPGDRQTDEVNEYASDYELHDIDVVDLFGNKKEAVSKT